VRSRALPPDVVTNAASCEGGIGGDESPLAQQNHRRPPAGLSGVHAISHQRVIVSLLNDYLRDGEVEVPGSRAQAEHAQERDLADDQIADPVVHIQVRAHHNLVAAIDHLGGVAACIEAENVALATISLLRPIVVAAGINYYMLDPSITRRERLRRGWNLGPHV